MADSRVGRSSSTVSSARSSSSWIASKVAAPFHRWRRMSTLVTSSQKCDGTTMRAPSPVKRAIAAVASLRARRCGRWRSRSTHRSRLREGRSFAVRQRACRSGYLLSTSFALLVQPFGIREPIVRRRILPAHLFSECREPIEGGETSSDRALVSDRASCRPPLKRGRQVACGRAR